MTILGIETSCDETSAAIIEADTTGITLKGHSVASSLEIHAQTGGVIPENAAREQLHYMLPVISQTLHQAYGTTDPDALQQIDAFAVTYGPGLIGSLLVGVETIKTIAFTLQKPVIPVNHMVGHIYANFIGNAIPDDTIFPALVLVVSGGHTDLLLMREHGTFTLLGGTRDDAAGEAFDKIGRLIGLPYPAGPIIEQKARQGNPQRFHFPRPLIGSPDFDFSFSGLKTAVLREVQQLATRQMDEQTIADLARATQDAIIDVLIKKTLRAAQENHVTSLLLSGGVAANQTLRDAFQKQLAKQTRTINFFAPEKKFCTDNAAMIATAAYYMNKSVSWNELTANPELYFE